MARILTCEWRQAQFSPYSICACTLLCKRGERATKRERGRKNVNPNKRSLSGLSGKHKRVRTLAGDWWRKRRKMKGREAESSTWLTTWTLRTSYCYLAGPGIFELDVVSIQQSRLGSRASWSSLAYLACNWTTRSPVWEKGLKELALYCLSIIVVILTWRMVCWFPHLVPGVSG